MWKRGDPAEREQRRAEKAAARANRSAAYDDYRHEMSGLATGTHPNAFVTVSMPRTAGTPNWSAAFAFAREHGMFDAEVTIVPGPNSDQSGPLTTPGHVEAPDAIRVPAGTRVFDGDRVLLGESDTAVRLVDDVARVGSEYTQTFPYLDGCREQCTGKLVGRPHILLHWRIGNHSRTSEEPMPRVVLFVAANPTVDLDLEEEIRSTSESLSRSRHRDQIQLVQGPAARPTDLITLVRDHHPAVLHFSGHGSGAGIAMREDGGGISTVTGPALSQFLQDRGIELVVFNSCFSEAQARTAVSCVRAVVGTTDALDDSSAQVFSSTLYRALGDGLTLEDSFRDACDAVALTGHKDVFHLDGDRSYRLTVG